MKKTAVFSNETLARLFRALALLLHAGISLSDSVYLVKEDEDGAEAAALQAIGESMDCGATLSRAMEESGYFPHHAVSMVEVGETTGHLESSLVSLADYYDEEAAMSREVRSTLLYPCILFAMILAVIGVLVVQVLPVFDSVYASLGGNLTGIAAGLLSLGNALRAVMPVILVVLGAAAIFALCCVVSPALRTKVVSAYRRKYGHKGVGGKMASACFALSLSMALESGMYAEEALLLSANLLKDTPTLAKAAEQAAEAVKSGTDLAEALKDAALLSPKDCRMLIIGNKSGRGSEVMSDIARRASESAREAARAAVSRIEPAMVLSAGVIVGVILLSVMLPLMNIMSAIG